MQTKKGEGIRERDEVLMGRYQAAAEVSYAERKSVFVVGLRGGIDLPSSWLTFFFRQSSSVSFLSHTHTFPRPCFFIFFIFAIPSFSPTLSQINLCPLFSLPALNPRFQHAQTHSLTHTALVLTATAVRWNLFFFPPFSEVPSTLFLPHGNPTSLCTL